MKISYCFSKVVETYLAEIRESPALESKYYPGFQIMLSIFRVIYAHSGDMKLAYENTVHAGQLYIEYMKQDPLHLKKDSGYVTFIYEKILSPMDLFSATATANIIKLNKDAAEELSGLGEKCNQVFEWSRGDELTLSERLLRAPRLYDDAALTSL